jgi:hypothetical protein
MEAQTREPQMGLTFEQVWAALMELRESQRETERLLRESQQETARVVKETNQSIGGLNNYNGPQKSDRKIRGMKLENE